MIRVEHLNKTYDPNRRNANQVLHDICLTLPDTGFVCILGPSGCGKTSLLNAIGGLDVYDSGNVTMDDGKAGRSNFGYVFQNYYLLPEHSVGYNVYLSLHSLELSHAEKLRRVREALAAVDMERYIRRNVAELSGGQQQRIAIAQALVRHPRVIFADEPTGNLDEANTRNICSILRRISKNSLVVMVTHEERIARFFADRIITLENGRIVSDRDRWNRGSLEDSNTIYTGDYPGTTVQADKVTLQIYQEEGCAPAAISILALKDRIVIKLDDSRIVTCTGSGEQPVVIEGKRPEITLESVEQEQGFTWEETEPAVRKPGQGIGLKEMFREARHMNRGKGIRSLGTRLFLIVLAVLTAISVADFIALSTVDPEDFVQTHSQAMLVTLERGSNTGTTQLGMQTLSDEFKSWLDESGLAYDYAPVVPDIARVSGSPILQTSQLSVTLSRFSYVPLEMLDEDTLVQGRLPRTADEVVVDRWVLEAILRQDGVARNGITGIDYFLGKQIRYDRQSYTPTIVGICDSGEPAVYLSDEALANLGSGFTAVAGLSTLQAAFPGKYDDVTLAENECIVLPANAGSSYRDKLHANFRTSTGLPYEIVMSIEETDFHAKIVVADSQLDDIGLSMSTSSFWIFSPEKEEMTAWLQSIPEKMENRVQVTVTDSYTDQMNAYREASRLQADARTIVTATIMVMSMVMLYLLRRSQVQERMGMLAVYRLLDVPARKLAGIFALESLLSTLTAALPAVLAAWVWIAFSGTELLLPWYGALAVYLGIAAYHLLVSVVPLIGLLRLPPAQLAAKFDF